MPVTDIVIFDKSIFKLERYLLRFCIVSGALPVSLRNAGLDTITLQSVRDFNIAAFNRKCHLQSSLNRWWKHRLFQHVR